jgi:hypothetical protein
MGISLLAVKRNSNRSGGFILKKLLLLCSMLFAVNAYAADSGYRVIKKLEVGGEGGWDYLTVDGPARRLYLSRGNHVMVVDLDTDKMVGDVLRMPQ